MFTGIITEVGEIRTWRREPEGLRLRIRAPATVRGLKVGGSVAVDGVCLSAVEVGRGWFAAQLVPETSRRSTLNHRRLSKGARRVNLERPLKLSGELGGHFVQGHVDARARVAGLRRLGREAILAVQLPASLRGLLVEKGSIAVNGVSLTVASVSGRRRARFTVALIPHTLRGTNLGELEAGDWVNLEADILGKCVKALRGAKR